MCPLVIQSIKETNPAEFPSNVYKKEIATKGCCPALQPVLKPRNIRQVTNHMAIQRQKFRLSHDELYNIHEIALDLDGFVHKIITYPDLIIVCGHSKLLNEMEQLIQLGETTGQLLSYDIY